MRKRLLRIALVLFLFALALPGTVLARAGGGQNYSAGSSSGSPSSGSASGFATSSGGGSNGAYDPNGYQGGSWSDVPHNIWTSVVIFFTHPVIWAPVLGMVAVLWWARRRAFGPQAPTPRRSKRAQPRADDSGERVQGFVDAIRKRDPEFVVGALYARAHRVFHLLQQGWFDRSLEHARPFLSDATYQRFVVQLDLMARQGVRNAICDWHVLDVQWVGLEQNASFDVAHLRIRAQMRDTDVPASTSDADAIAAAKRKAPEPFVEVWSFVRRPGAKTKKDADLMQGRCPNCGAPYGGGASNVCGYCKAVVNSGNDDWTLAEITQGVEEARGTPSVDGLVRAREADPALSLEVLEDRASLVFWRWVEAQAKGDTRVLSKLAVAGCSERLGTELAGIAARKRRKVFLDCAVGAVNTRLLRSDEGFDQAHVEIRWSARVGLAPLDGPPRELPVIPQRWVFVLLRKSGVRTREDFGISTHRCTGCGAALTDDGLTSCAFCGVSFAAAEHDWMLLDASPYETWCANERQRRDPASQTQATYRAAEVIADHEERERLLYMMAALAGSDGQVAEPERQLLRFCADRWSVPWHNVELALQGGPEFFDKLLPASASGEARVFLETLIRIAHVDGKIGPEERRMVETAAARLGMTDQLPVLLATS